MHFISFTFFVFFAIVFAGYWSIHQPRLRMGWLLLASCVFYMSWNPWLILLILTSASVDYFAAIAMNRTASPVWKRRLLIMSVTANLGLLCFFKYVNFFVANLTGAINLVGIDFNQRVFEIALPLGISFYTFETISYVVDVYRGKTKPLTNLLDYALFIMFFPHLLAGPIVRPAHFLPQLQQRKRWNWNRLRLGGQLFLLGMFKKSVIADHLATVVDPVFKDPTALYSTMSLWLAVLAYAMQVYGDFSGYSDMAIGLAHCFGFKLPPNFTLPYFAHNISEFWRRWHISLSTWLRDYLFISLGGSRGGSVKTYRNLIITMFLGGLWHGANWPSVLWGTYHGLLLAGHRFFSERRWLEASFWRWTGVPITFFACVFGLAIFRSQSIADIGTVLGKMFWIQPGNSLAPLQVWIAVLQISAMFAEHAIGTWGRKLLTIERRIPVPVLGAVCAAVILVVLILIPNDSRAFIYFNF